MPLALSVLSTVPVRLSVRNTLCLLHIFYTLFITPPQNVRAMMDSLCRVRPSVGPSVLLHYRVRSINPIPIDGFYSNLAAMLTSSRGCAEPMLPLCQLNVKVTIEGQISNNQILDIMSCPLCKSYTNWKNLFNLGSNVHLNKGMCRTHVILLPA